MDEKILTKHPKGKGGRNISAAKYHALRKAIIERINKRDATHTELLNCVAVKLKGTFEGNLPWYMETVKLDLEARGIIKRMPKTKPQTYRLTKK